MRTCNPFDPNAVALARKISAALEPSEEFPKLLAEDMQYDGKVMVEHWSNGLWNATKRHFKEGWPLGGGEYVLLCIHCEDGEPRHDWRIFQAIKNQLCGEEWEGIELYPAESRLLDPSNLFMLWCAPKIPIGKYEGRRIMGPDTCIAPQRGWKNGAASSESPPESRIEQKSVVPVSFQ